MEILKSSNLELDRQKLINEIKTILQPYVESLWALVNSATVSKNLDLKQDVKYFKNLYFLTDKFLSFKYLPEIIKVTFDPLRTLMRLLKARLHLKKTFDTESIN